ncbi:GMC family oxidoreductase [Hoeflea prorocentri]|uniref:Choline dehydrogenase n=1 Tax=Hoeflea prorocentri TaxID=1922333 RepID=A0A9X3UIN2_9HYPH|nr:choline dehydrogenase [Hoeflea prorocentri]MCY6381352.1 choline dehydrogenase [Hoeflea prorocentri]MDA5399152.1 choline dehydrogenase [Hoeflea prorocentri]
MYDYVIVGGGSAGCALAARLSEDPNKTVCLLEAGGDSKGLLFRMPVGAAAMLSGWPFKINNWAYETVPQPGLNGRKGYQPRGKALGGSSGINAMLYVRGHRTDYDHWADIGCDGWSFEDVLPYFRVAENNERGGDVSHGADGPLHVCDQRSPRPISSAFLEAAIACQHKYTDDFNGEEQEGVGLYQVTQFHDRDRNGERCSAAAAYVYPNKNRPNLTVITRAHATRVLFDGKRAIGVAYSQGSKQLTVRARQEVILSGGAFNSPQLLMLSGIGPADELRNHGIGVVHELPGVGRNLQDHLDYVFLTESGDTDLVGLSFRALGKKIAAAAEWAKTGHGLLASPFSEAGAFLKTDPRLERPDIQLHFVVAMLDNHSRTLHFGHGYSCHVCVLRPHSRGSVGLSDSNPISQPRIDPCFLADKRDEDALLGGVKLTRQILEAPALQPYRKRDIYPYSGLSDEELREDIRARADTVYHPVGTCKMGTDNMAVVDPRLKVRGLEGLRVVDASIMPTIIGGNTNAPAIMIAEKAADMIRADAK